MSQLVKRIKRKSDVKEERRSDDQVSNASGRWILGKGDHRDIIYFEVLGGNNKNLADDFVTIEGVGAASEPEAIQTPLKRL